MQCMTLYRLVEAQVILRKVEIAWQLPFPTSLSYIAPAGKHLQSFIYLVKARMILAEMWRKKMDAMNESERTRTMKGSLQWYFFGININRKWGEKNRRTPTLEALASRPCKA